VNVLKAITRIVGFSVLTGCFLWMFYLMNAMAVHISYEQGGKAGYEQGFKQGYGHALDQCSNQT